MCAPGRAPKGDSICMDSENIGAFVAARRKAMEMTQQQLAQVLGVTNKAVSKWERGLGLPDITALPDLAAALGVSVDELLAGEAAAGQPPVPEKAQAPQAPAPGLGEKVPQGPLFCVEDIFAPSALSLAARAGRHTARRHWVVRILFALLILSGASALWLAGHRGDIGLYALAAVAGALAVLYGAEVFFGALSRLSLRAAARRAGMRSAQFWEDSVLLQSPGESARLAYSGITDAWQGPQGLCLFWGRRALPVPGDALEAEQFQALARHLRIHTPQVRWKQGQAPMRRRLPRPLRAVILVFALAAALGTAAYGAGLRASLSPSLQLAVFYKNPVTGKALHLRGFRAQQFPYTVQGGLKLQWLTGDVCTATYEGEDGRTHQYIATFGDRGSGVSYYYVGSALVGVWEPIGQNTAGWRLEATDGPDGHVTLENGSYCYEYEYSDCVQAGTLALALCRGGIPEWTVALGQDFEFQNADTGGVAGGGSIVVCRVSMEKTAPLTMNYLGYPG